MRVTVFVHAPERSRMLQSVELLNVLENEAYGNELAQRATATLQRFSARKAADEIVGLLREAVH